MNIPAVRQVVNVLELMEYFARTSRPASLASIHKDLGWPRSSTYSLLQTLVGQGYLYEPQVRGEFYPSSKWAEVVQRIEKGAPISPALKVLISNVRDLTEETCSLLAVSGDCALFIAIEESPELVRFTAPVGSRIPLHATASGRALLSQMSPTERNALYKRVVFQRYTDSTLMNADAVEDEVARSLANGYFFTKGEHVRGSGGIALPLRSEGRTIAVLVAGPTDRIVNARDHILRVLWTQLEKANVDVLVSRASFKGVAPACG